MSKCIAKLTDYRGTVYYFQLLHSDNHKTIIDKEALKEKIKNGTEKVENLKVTKDNRLISIGDIETIDIVSTYRLMAAIGDMLHLKDLETGRVFKIAYRIVVSGIKRGNTKIQHFKLSPDGRDIVSE